MRRGLPSIVRCSQAWLLWRCLLHRLYRLYWLLYWLRLCGLRLWHRRNRCGLGLPGGLLRLG